MAKKLPPTGIDRVFFNDLVKLAKKEHNGRTLTAGEERRRESDFATLKKHGYSIAEVNNYIVGRLGDRSGKVGFGIGDITVGNPIDSAKFLMDKAKLDFLGKLFDPHTWLRVMFIILGGILFLLGLGLLLKELGKPKLAKAVPLGRVLS